MTHSDGGKGSARRNEDVRKINENWDRIFGSKKKTEETKMIDDDGEVICDVCGSEMSATEHGLYMFCDVCGHREEFEWDDSNAPD